MGLEIEQHLQRNVRILEKRQALYDDFLRSGLLELQKFHECQRTEIMEMLEEESSQLSAVVAEIQEKLSKIYISTENSENPVNKLQCWDSSKDVHVTTDVAPNTGTSSKGDPPAVYSSVTSEESKALAQAMQEKMEVLMLLSQEQERYLFEKQRNQIIIEDLQKNLSQVKEEKVKVLMELAKLKEDYSLLKGSSSVKEVHGTGDSLKVNLGHDQHGILKSMLKRTSLSHWMRKDSCDIEYGSSGRNDYTVCNEHSVEIARLKDENTTLMESVSTVERLTSSVHRMHVVLLKAYNDVKSAVSLESTNESLNSLITEANLMKTALGVLLPVSWSGNSSDATTYKALYDPSDSLKSKSEKVNPLSSSGMEMVELLILAAEILKESFVLKPYRSTV